MQLKLIGSNVIIKSCNISNAAKAILSLQHQGTQVDSGGGHYFNDIDNLLFQYECNNLQNRTFLDINDFKALLSCWFWSCNYDNNQVNQLLFSTPNDYMDEKSEDIILLRALAPYIEDSSYLLFVREDFDYHCNNFNYNFVKFDFYLGRVIIRECFFMDFADVLPNTPYDCFNNIQTIISGKPITNNTVKPVNKVVKYGGNCKKCGLYDDYAEQDDSGEVLCYQCNGKT